MMDEYTVKRLGLILAMQAEIEGMKAENIRCDFEKIKPTFGKFAFNNIAEAMREAVYKHNEQL